MRDRNTKKRRSVKEKGHKSEVFTGERGRGRGPSWMGPNTKKKHKWGDGKKETQVRGPGGHTRNVPQQTR